MSKGYLGVSRKPRDLTVKPFGENGADTDTMLGGSNHAALHVVDVDRRSSERLDFFLLGAVSSAHCGLYGFAKRCFDIGGALFGLVLLSPLFLFIVLAAMTSNSKPFFRHRRVGKHGVIFDCLKFRTMVANADKVLQDLLRADRQAREEWLRDHKLRDDPRITRLGRFLRRTSLDELPQLWNVLIGEMSLVGPRPVVPEELRRYRSKIRVYLSVRPGLTGLWQVSGRNDLDYRRRVALDVCYVRAGSVVLDSYILLRTIPAVFAKNGAY